MKIKAYFITYKNNVELEGTMRSFSKSGILNYDHEIFIINNSVDVPVVIPDVKVRYKIVDNNTRPTFSTGHLARNWNECLIDGFKNVDNPDADIVMLCQNDIRFNKNSIHKLVELHNTYSFIQDGCGDSFHSYTIEAIKKVGLWDERFCNIGCQEGDYFVRQRLFNADKCTINDKRHWREHNPIETGVIVPYNTGWDREDVHHRASIKYHGISNVIFMLKYNNASHMHWDEGWVYEMHYPQSMMYPYFEDKFAINNPNYIKY
jgi:hypothetical protein